MAIAVVNALVALLCVLITIIVLFNRTLRFHVKYYLHNSCYMVLAVLCVPLCLLNPGDVSNTRWPALLTRYSVKHIFGIKLDLRHVDRLKSDTPYIIVCNHQSALDTSGMMEVLPERCTILMKSMFKYMGPFGLAAMMCGIIFVDRGNKAQTKEVLEQTVEVIKKKNAKVWIFPEGTRRNDEDCGEPMLPFKKGAFNLAVQAQVPIVPIVLSSQSSFFIYEEKKFTKGGYTVTVMPHVSTVGLTLEDVPHLAERVRRDMIQVYKDTSIVKTTVNGAAR